MRSSEFSESSFKITFKSLASTAVLIVGSLEGHQCSSEINRSKFSRNSTGFNHVSALQLAFNKYLFIIYIIDSILGTKDTMMTMTILFQKTRVCLRR